MIEKLLYPTHLSRCINSGPSKVGKSVFLTSLVLNIFNEFEKVYIYSPSLHQELYQRLIKCFNNYLAIHIIPKVLNEEGFDKVIDQVVKNKDFEKSDTEIETYESIEEKNIHQNMKMGVLLSWMI